MKKHLHFLVALAALVFQTSAYGQWSKHAELPAGGRIIDMTADQSGTLYVLAGFQSDIYYSTNNGAGWTRMPNTLTQWTITDIEVDKRSGVLYAGGIDGLHWSADKGRTWQMKQFLINTQSGPAMAAIPVIAMNQGTGLIVAHEESGMNVSADGGLTWTHHFVGNFRHAHSLGFLPGGELFAGTDNGAFLSTDDGLSWSAANGGMQDMRVTSMTKDRISGLLFASTDLNSRRNDTSGTGIYVSANGGLSWSPASSGIANRVSRDVMADSATGHVYAATESGIYVSTNSGATWLPLNGNLQDLRISCLEKTAAGFFAGTIRTGVAHAAAPALGWTYANNGISTHSFVAFDRSSTGGFFLLDGHTASGLHHNAGSGVWQQPSLTQLPTAPGRLMTRDIYGHIYASFSALSGTGHSASLYRLSGSSGSWTDLTGRIPVTPPFVITAITDLEPSAAGDLYVLCRVYHPSTGQSSRVFRSTDSGGTFTSIISTPVAGFGVIRDMEPSPGGKLYLAAGPGTVANRIAVTPDNGVTIAAVPTGALTLAPGFTMAVGLHDTLYVMSANALYSSFGAGGWAALPNGGWGTGNDARIYPDGRGSIYISTDDGVFGSVNGGRSWTDLTAGIPTFSGISGSTRLRLDDFQFDAAGNVYAYSTNEEAAADPFHGIYRLGAAPASVGNRAPAAGRFIPVPNPAGRHVLLSGAAKLEPEAITVYDGAGRVVMRVTDPVKGTAGDIELDVSRLSAGVYLIELAGKRERAVGMFLKL